MDRSEVVKGYEYDDGKYVILTPADIEKITPESSRNMEILSFVDNVQIDPLFFNASYFIVPEEEGRKGYQLLLKTLEDTKRVAVAKITMYQREFTVFMRPYDHGLALHTIYFKNEIREVPGYGKTDNIKLSAQEIKLTDQLVETLSEDFHLEKYHDEFQERLSTLIAAKQKSKVRDISTARKPAGNAPARDMMDALKKSLAAPKANGRQLPRSKHGPQLYRRAVHRATG